MAWDLFLMGLHQHESDTLMGPLRQHFFQDGYLGPLDVELEHIDTPPKGSDKGAEVHQSYLCGIAGIDVSLLSDQ